VRYCITGGSGFIGSYFCRELSKAGHDLTIVDLIKPPPGLPHDRFVQGDIRDPKAVKDAMTGCERLLHLAAAHHDFGIAYDTYFSVNEAGSRVLCDAMDHSGIKQMCFYSTVAVYGDTPEPHHEDSPCNPVSPYGKSKLAGEKVFQEWTGKGGGRGCLVIRPTVTFGPHNFANMYSLIRQIHRKRFLQVGPGTNIKSLSYIENIMAATLYLWEKPDRAAFDVYNYIDKPDLTSREISAAIYDALNWKFPKLHFPLGLALFAALPFDAVIKLTGKNLPISGARVKKLFNDQTKYEADRVLASGFKPPVTLREGIARMVHWYVEKGRNESAEWHQPPAEVVMLAGR
jgi:nucleoside-diphosphate-sugar epimerase